MLAAAEAALADAGVGRASSARDRDHEPARDDAALGAARPGGRLHRAIVWQDRRTAERCRELPAELIRERTGLVPDPYFSATKLEWLLARTDLPQGELAFGTVDAWLVWKLTGGRVHATDVTNASRTMLLDLDDRSPGTTSCSSSSASTARCCPGSSARPRSSARRELLGATLPIAGIAGDQQAALFGHGCFDARRGEGDVRHGQLRARQRRGRARERRRRWPARDARRRSGPAYALEGAVLVERRRDPVAARRARR